MTLLNRPIGIWVVVVYALISVLRTAMNLFAVSSASTATYYNWDYYLFSCIHIFLGIALMVTAFGLRKSAVPIMITMIVLTILGYARPMYQLTAGGNFDQGIIVSIMVSLASGIIVLGLILWYLLSLKRRGVLS